MIHGGIAKDHPARIAPVVEKTSDAHIQALSARC